MIVFVLVLYTLEILVPSHIGHGREDLRKAPAFWLQQEFFKQGAMFGFHAPTMPCGTLFECINDMLIKVSDDEACHGCHLG